MWDQIYDPLNSKFLSTCAAALPVVTLLVLIASNKVKAHIAALVALVVANFIAIVIFTMPADMSLRATVLGAVTGFFPIGWIVLLRASPASIRFFWARLVGRQLPFFSLIVPFWLIWAFAGYRGMKEIWPAILVTGVSFAIPQFLISNFINPWIVDIGASLISMACLIGFLKIWRPKVVWTSPALRTHDDSAATMPKQPVKAAREPTTAEVWFSLLPWIIVCVILLLWGTNAVKGILNAYATGNFPVPGLHNMINKVAPVVPAPTKEAAVFSFTWLSYTGSGMLIAAIISGLLMGFTPVRLVKAYGETIRICAYSLITISAMLAIGTLTRLSGIDATLGLAFAGTGVLYPFFGTLLGWLGVALTGSDTASNILFGNLQKITSQQLGLSPILMAAANSSGGVMGKMIDAQSIVVASTATNWFGHEGTILRFVFKHSIALACLVGVLVMLQAYVFTGMIVK